MKERLSNFELLRILAMFLVLVVHANFFSINVPTHIECIRNGAVSFFRFFIESISIVCVDVFVLLSGYFGIKCRVKSFFNLFFQIIFWGGGALSFLFIPESSFIIDKRNGRCFFHNTMELVCQIIHSSFSNLAYAKFIYRKCKNGYSKENASVLFSF